VTIVRLIVKNNVLYFPFGGIDHDSENFHCSPELPSILSRLYSSGDYDTIPWPMPKRSRAKHLKNLAHALFDERECNSLFPAYAVIELPDGSVFDIDAHLDSSERIAWKKAKV
jgi:hypothetical protein